MRRSTRIIAGVVLLAVGVLIFRPFGGEGECEGAPCESGFVWRIWVAIGIVVLWLAGMVWFIVAMIRAPPARKRRVSHGRSDELAVDSASPSAAGSAGRAALWIQSAHATRAPRWAPAVLGRDASGG